MSLIYIKGRRDPFEISFDKAATLKAKWSDGGVKPDAILDVGSMAFRKSEIKFIELTKEVVLSEHADNTAKEAWKSWCKQIKESVETKSSRLEWFKLVCKIFTGKEATPEQLKQAKILQQEFFAKEPISNVIDPIFYREILGAKKASLGLFVKTIESIYKNELENRKFYKQSEGKELESIDNMAQQW